MIRYFIVQETNRFGDVISLIEKHTEHGCYSIPCNEGNADYQAYLAWVAEGNTAEEWEPEESE